MGNRVYLDTVIISSIIKNDLPAIENASVDVILDAYQERKIELWTTERARDEMQKIPSKEHRTIHTRFYKLILSAPVVQEVRTNSGLTTMGVGGGNTPDPLFSELLKILDEGDAKHVFQAVKNGMSMFLTNDGGILNRKDQILNQGLEVLRPSELATNLKLSNDTPPPSES